MGGAGADGVHRDALADGSQLGIAAGRAAGRGGTDNTKDPSGGLAAVSVAPHDASSAPDWVADAPQPPSASLGATCAAGPPDPSAGVVVVIPTVTRRAAELRTTVRQLQDCGLSPFVTQQPCEIPTGSSAQRANADEAIASGLRVRPRATHLLYVEDDADIDPALAQRLPELLAADVPITLFTPARSYYPDWVRRCVDDGRPIPPSIVRVRAMNVWVGTIAVLLPRRVAELVRDWSSEFRGWDVHLRECLRAHSIALYVAVPNLAQHRDVGTTVGSRRGVVSVTFGWPTA